MPTDLDEIKNRINLVDLIGDYVQLKKAGVNFRALCPFHEEKTPSFLVSPSKQIWHCFGCSLGGDHFGFIKEIEGVEFREALEILARRAGVQLQKRTAAYVAETDKKKVLYEINELAAQFYQNQLLQSPTAQAARDYLKRRGLKSETIQQWRLGYALDDFHSFENYIISKGFQKQEAADAGLLVKKEEAPPGQARGQAYFDRFRGRIMFPLFDVHGRIIGFTGRILVEQEGAGKYVNSPETPIYSKSQILYGLNFAKSEIRKQSQAIVVEGNMDVITCHEAGFKNVVASSGTALTSRQLEILKRFTEHLSFAFDVDTAGLAALRRAVEQALSQGFNIRVIRLPRELAKDPDELIRKDQSLWQKQVTEAENFLDFYFEQTFAKLDIKSSMGKKQAIGELAALIALLPDPIDRTHYLKLLSDRTGVTEQIILEKLNEQPQPAGVDEPAVKQPLRRVLMRKSKLEILEQRLAGFILKFAEELREEVLALNSSEFLTPKVSEVVSRLQQQLQDQQFTLPAFLSVRADLKLELELMLFGVENELQQLSDWNLDKVKKEFFDVWRQEALRQKMQQLSSRIRVAETAGRSEELQLLSTEFNNLSKELSKFNG